MTIGQIIGAGFGFVIIAAVPWNVRGPHRHDGGADPDSWQNDPSEGSDGSGGHGGY